MITEEQQKELEALAKPLLSWLSKNLNPHTKLIIDSDSCELLGGLCSVNIKEEEDL